jgi:hypothetical protein
MKKVGLKKLTLSKETLRALEEPDLRAANGAETADTCFNSCFTTTCGTLYC